MYPSPLAAVVSVCTVQYIIRVCCAVRVWTETRFRTRSPPRQLSVPSIIPPCRNPSEVCSFSLSLFHSHSLPHTPYTYRVMYLINRYRSFALCAHIRSRYVPGYNNKRHPTPPPLVWYYGYDRGNVVVARL